MKRTLAVFLSLSVIPLLASCRFKPDESTAPSPTAMADGSTNFEETTPPYKVKFETSKGPFVVEVHPDWAPIGAARFRELVESDFFVENRFFRNMPGFIVQWGINGDPAVQAKWRDKPIKDDPVVVSNTPGTIVFATSGPNSRTTQLFINYGDNTDSLDPQGFSPFGKVIEGREVVQSFNSEYGEAPNQGAIQQTGNEYLKKEFPNLDYIISTEIIESDEQSPPPKAAKEDKQAETSPVESTETPASDTTEPEDTPAEPESESNGSTETIEEIQ